MADIREDDYKSLLNGSQMDTALLDMAEHTSEAWAVGERNGIDVSNIDPTYHNNAKYYAGLAASVVPTSGTPAIRYDVDQSEFLTDEQKATARKNLAIEASYIRLDAPQDLTDEEQLQAQQNIGINNVIPVNTPFASRITANGENIKDGLASIRAIRGRSEVVNDKIVDVTGVVSTERNIFSYNDPVISLNYSYKFVSNENWSISITDKDTSVSVSGCYLGVAVNPENVNEGYTWLLSGGSLSVPTSENIARVGTVGARCKYVFAYPKDKATWDKIFARYNVMINFGSTALPYEPYKSSSALFPPMRSAGSARDSWLNGVYTRKVGSRTFDGSADEGWIWNSGGYAYISDSTVKAVSVDTESLSTLNKVLVSELASATVPSVACGKTTATLSGFYIRVPSATQSKAGIEAWLASNPVTIYYELATPEVVELPIPPYTAYKSGSEYVIGDGILDADIEYGVDIVKDLQDLATAMPQTVLLWENASPTSAFPAQDLSIDWEIYRFLLIIYSKSAPTYYSSCVVDTSRGAGWISYTTIPNYNASQFEVRGASISSGLLKFTPAYANGTANDSACIPYRVYGIK